MDQPKGKAAGMRSTLIYGQPKAAGEAGASTGLAQILRKDGRPKPKAATNKHGISKHDAIQPHDRVVPMASFVDDVKRKVQLRKMLVDMKTPKPSHIKRQLKHLKKDLKKELTNGQLTGRHEGGPGSGPRGKFAPEQKPSDEERQIARFTHREKPGERTARIAGKKVDPAMSKAIRKALMAKREVLVNDETPGPGRLWQKEDVNYRYNSEINRSCGTCEHFIAPGTCEIVAGLIRPVDVCDKWESMEQAMKRTGRVPSQLVTLSYQLGESREGGPGSGPQKGGGKKADRKVDRPEGGGGKMTGHAIGRRTSNPRFDWVASGTGTGRMIRRDESEGGLPTKPGFTDIKGKGTGVKVHKSIVQSTITKLGGSDVSEAYVPSVLVLRPQHGVQELVQSKLADLTPPLVKLWRQAKKSGELEFEREVSPPGWEGTVKGMKKHPEITNPWALAWWMNGMGMTPHKKSKSSETHDEPGHVCKPAT